MPAFWEHLILAPLPKRVVVMGDNFKFVINISNCWHVSPVSLVSPVNFVSLVSPVSLYLLTYWWV